MPDYAGEKTLEPTPHRRQQARQEGHVAKSHDLGSAAMLLLGLAVLVTLGGSLAGFLADYCRNQLGGRPWLAADAASSPASGTPCSGGWGGACCRSSGCSVWRAWPSTCCKPAFSSCRKD